jgi:hypothetical protein
MAIALPALQGSGGAQADRPWTVYYLAWLGVALVLTVAGAFYRRDAN